MVSRERNHSVDAIKGFLIFTVVLGHILLGTLDDNPLRFFIYSFHMPAFFFISGYLLNMKKLASISPNEFLRKYWRRMLMPWSIAWLLYTAYVMRDGFDLRMLVGQIVSPYYHLWFIPSLFISISAIYVVLRYMKNFPLACTALTILGIMLHNLAYSNYDIPGDIWGSMMIFVVSGLICSALLKSVNMGGVYRAYLRVHSHNCRYNNGYEYGYV